MKAAVFPGQGAQFAGMAQSLLEHGDLARDLLAQADDILGFSVSEVMLTGTDEELKQTRVTQPAIFLHSVIRARIAGEDFAPEAVAGHSLGEFSALTAVGALTFEDGLRLVQRRAEAMQQAGEQQPGTMAAIVGLDDAQVEQICADTEGVVVAANYNCPGQLVISGELDAIDRACTAATEAGARRALKLPVGGAFHSPLMASARAELERAIADTELHAPRARVYQNVDAHPHTEPADIRANLIAQLTGPVRWTASIQAMARDGYSDIVEVGGKGSVLRGLIRKIDRELTTTALT